MTSEQATQSRPTNPESEGEVLVRVNGISKKFCRDLKKSLWYGVKDIASEINPFSKNGDQSSQLRAGEFWANREVSFELRRGQCIGLIGRNGAGKTTLLKMLNGLIKPDTGSIEMRGRVGALIALGAGFNPILTGRENIYVNGSILGLAKEEIDAKIEGIIDFAEVREFIDSPVQSYSSGMQVRLGFAVATALNPDILILDEVLAVGDASFRNKCYKRIAELRRTAAIIFVTHQMSHIARMCDQTLVLKKGQTVYYGGVEEGVLAYENLNEDTSGGSEAFLNVASPIRGFSCEMPSSTIQRGSDLELILTVEADAGLDNFDFRIILYSPAGEICLGSDTPNTDHGIALVPGTNKWKIVFPNICLKRGRYPMAFNLMDRKGELLVWSFKEHTLVVDAVSHGPSVDYQPVVSHWSLLDQ